jgi:hypothetical protein
VGDKVRRAREARLLRLLYFQFENYASAVPADLRICSCDFSSIIRKLSIKSRLQTSLQILEGDHQSET